jgi:tetratricopeptide (TPR) repeat protein
MRSTLEEENPMFNLSDKDYRIAEYVQAEMRREAEQAHLASAARAAQQPVTEEIGQQGPAILRTRWVVRALLVAVAVVMLLVGAQQALAGPPEPVRPDAGGPPEPFADAMRAYREGLYSLNHGDYDQAVVQLTAAIEGIPAEVIACVPAYQDMYWTLGEAQEAAGLAEEALISYQHWLALAGDEASPWTVVKVQELETQLNAMLVADTRA